jgi:DNA repair protein RadA/Sms
MAKSEDVYSCTECGASSPKWQGQCPGCGQWNTLVESGAEPGPGRALRRAGRQPAGVQALSDIVRARKPRQPTGVERVRPRARRRPGSRRRGADRRRSRHRQIHPAAAGAGARWRGAQAGGVLYVSGEESGEQVALRAQRLQLPPSRLQMLAEINLERILHTLREARPRVAVIDSIQTVYSEALQSAPGSVAQVRECAAQLTRFAKQSGTSLILVGHVTKDGTLAGPRVLEHIVDTVLYFEGDTTPASA